MENTELNLNELGLGAGDPSISPNQSGSSNLLHLDSHSDGQLLPSEIELLENLPLSDSSLGLDNGIFLTEIMPVEDEYQDESNELIYSTVVPEGVTVLTGADVHLDFDETSGSIANDNQMEDGNQFGRLRNGAAFEPASDFLGGAVVFDGVDDYVSIRSSRVIDRGRHAERSIGIWFQLNSSDGQQVIYEEGSRYHGLNIYVDNDELYVGEWDRGIG